MIKMAIALALLFLVMFPISNSYAARVSLTIRMGTLGFTSGPPVLTPISIVGLDQVTTGTLGLIDVKDARGSGAGWQMTAQATDFVSRTDPSHTIAAAGFAISEAPSVIRIAGNHRPHSFSGSLDGSIKFLSASLDDGMGHFQIEPMLTLDIPADTFAGTYDSTLTTTLISGP